MDPPSLQISIHRHLMFIFNVWAHISTGYIWHMINSPNWRNIAAHRHPSHGNKTLLEHRYLMDDDGYLMEEWIGWETGLINHIDHRLFLYLYTSCGNVKPYEHHFCSYCNMAMAHSLPVMLHGHHGTSRWWIPFSKEQQRRKHVHALMLYCWWIE